VAGDLLDLIKGCKLLEGIVLADYTLYPAPENANRFDLLLVGTPCDRESLQKAVGKLLGGAGSYYAGEAHLVGVHHKYYFGQGPDVIQKLIARKVERNMEKIAKQVSDDVEDKDVVGIDAGMVERGGLGAVKKEVKAKVKKEEEVKEGPTVISDDDDVKTPTPTPKMGRKARQAAEALWEAEQWEAEQQQQAPQPPVKKSKKNKEMTKLMKLMTAYSAAENKKQPGAGGKKNKVKKASKGNPGHA
jgi:hypothetical protein